MAPCHKNSDLPTLPSQPISQRQQNITAAFTGFNNQSAQQSESMSLTVSTSRPMVLALNSGSSSLKASVIQSNNGSTTAETVAAATTTTIVSFLAERLMTADSVIHVVHYDDESTEAATAKHDLPKGNPQASLTHGEALSLIIEYLRSKNLLSNLLAVGHRVVHGGTIFSDSAIIEEQELKQIQSISHLAPL
jgi:acetate kinase